MTETDSPVAEITAAELKTLLGRGESAALLDVREDFERDHCAIQVPIGVVDLQIPMREIPDRLSEIVEAATGRSLVVYCHHGQRSMAVALWLSKQGLSGLANLEGGIDSWSRNVDPAVPRY